MSELPTGITFTVVGYEYQHEWEMFINCLLLQTDSRWKCQLINDGPDSVAKRICSKYVKLYPDKFEFLTTKERINDWGHSLRSLGLGMADTKYWSTQNADNYLIPTFVEYVLSEFEHFSTNRKIPDMVIFPCVHNYPNINNRGDPPYTVLNVSPRRNRCDAGSFVMRTEIAQSVGWNHTFNEADGAFIEDVMKLKPVVSTLPNILMVHN
jgi:hypothetical protein